MQKIIAAVNQWKRGAYVLAVFFVVVVVSGLPIAFLAQVVGQASGWHVDGVSWWCCASLLLGPYFVADRLDDMRIEDEVRRRAPSSD